MKKKIIVKTIYTPHIKSNQIIINQIPNMKIMKIIIALILTQVNNKKIYVCAQFII